MNEGEQALVRRVLLIALGVSAVAAPANFAGTPAAVPTGWVVLHSSVMLLLVVALWRRWITPRVCAASAGVIAGLSAFVIARAMAAAVAGGDAPAAGLAMVSLPAVVGAGGVVFLAVRSRLAVAAGLVVLLSQVLAIVLGAGPAWRQVLLAEPVQVALRFGVIAVILFGLVSVIAERRGTERDAAALARERADARTAIERERAALRDRVLTEAAHELQSPLTVVRGSLELLMTRQDTLAPEQRASLEDGLWRALARLEERTQSVLRAGVDTGTGTGTADAHDVDDVDVPRAPEPLGELVRRARASCPPAVAERVSSDVPEVLVAVPRPDADHVLENLLSNAWRYGPSDLPIRVTAESSRERVRLIVHDGGTTLRADEAARVFERGYRADSTRALADGSGVGLSLVARLVEGWGGSFGCDVDEDGTRVWVTLPVA